MSQTVKISVLDQNGTPVEGAIISLIDTDDGQSISSTTDNSGSALLTAPESEYTLHAYHPNEPYLSTNQKIKVEPAPSDLPAYFTPSIPTPYNLLSPLSKNIKVGIDSFPDTVIDLTGGDGLVVSLTELISNINTQLSSVDPSLSSVASISSDRFLLTSPTTGDSSSIRIISDGSFTEDASDIIFGEKDFGVWEVNGISYPAIWNDFEVRLTRLSDPVSTDPTMCMVWDRSGDDTIYPNSSFEIEFRPKIVPRQLPGFSLFSASKVIPVPAGGEFQVELKRNASYTVYLPWLDSYYEFTVPDLPGIRLSELLFPKIVELVFAEEEPVIITVGETKKLPFKGKSYLGYILDLYEVNVLSLTSLNSATVEVVDNMTIKGISVGQTTVNASYVNSYGDLIQYDLTVIVQ